MKCLKCGAENKDDSIFCEKCGTKLKQKDKTSLKSKKRILWWNKQSKNTKIMIVTAGIVLIILLFVSSSYSSHYPNESQYQSKATDWKADLDSATQLGSGPFEDFTPSDYVNVYESTANSLSNIEEDMDNTVPPTGYMDFHSSLWNEIDNFRLGYEAMAASHRTDDNTQMAKAAQYFKEAHKYEDMANQQERNLNF